MKNFIRTTVKKHVVLKVFAELAQVKSAIEHITKTDNTHTQLTLLVKQGAMHNADRPCMQQIDRELEVYWKNLLGKNTELGFFLNPEIGTVFVVGALSELFLYNVDGKKLGAITAGPYGILRGLGIEEPVAADHIKKLNEGLYLLLVRTSQVNMEGLEDSLKKIG